MKKFISLILAAAMALSVFAVSALAEEAEKPSFKVAIVQQLDHASLDEIRTAAESRLLALAAENGVTVTEVDKSEFQTAIEPVYSKILETCKGEDLYEILKQEINK